MGTSVVFSIFAFGLDIDNSLCVDPDNRFLVSPCYLPDLQSKNNAGLRRIAINVQEQINISSSRKKSG